MLSSVYALSIYACASTPWLDPGRDHPTSAEAWGNADASVDYLSDVEHCIEFISDIVFGSGSDVHYARNLLSAELWSGGEGGKGQSPVGGGGGGGEVPPMLVQLGGIEVLAGEARTFAAVVTDAGVDIEVQEYEGMPHVFQVFDAIAPEAKAAIKSASSFVSRVARG